MRAWVTEPFRKWGAQVHVKETIEKFCGLNWQQWRHNNQNMMSLTYTTRRSKLHYFRKNCTSMKTYRWTTWNSNRLLQGRFQDNNVTRAHHTIYTDLIKPFDACITEIPFAFILDGAIVALWRQVGNNKRGVLNITSLLNNLHHRAMTSPVNPLRTRLIHINPSYWTIHGSLEVILKMGTVHWIGLEIQCSMHIQCFKKHPVWYELYFLKYVMA